MAQGRDGSDRPRILYLITDPISTRLVRGQLAYLREAGFDVELASAPGAELHKFEMSEGVVVHELPYVREPEPFNDLKALAATVRLIRQRHPQIVNASTPKAGLLGMLAAALCRVPVRVYVVRGFRFETLTGLRRTLFKLLERLAVGCSTHTLFNSGSLRVVAQEQRVIRPDKGIVLGAGSGNGVGVERFAALPNRETVRSTLGIPADAFVIGFVGRLVRDKGFVDLMEAFDLVAATHRQMRLLVVGEYEPGDPIEEAIRCRVATDGSVVVTGWVSDPSRFYAAMDLFIFPSYREGLPNVPLEAQAAALPVVAYAGTGTVDVVHDGSSGVLVPVGDSTALATAIRALASDSQRRMTLGSTGASWVRDAFAQTTLWEDLRERLESWSGR